MDKRLINPSLYTGQNFVATRSNFTNFTSFTNQPQAYYPPYTYAQYCSGYPCQDFYVNSYGHQMQDGYLPFHVQSMPNPNSYSPSFNEQGLYQQNIPAVRPHRGPFHENTEHRVRFAPISAENNAGSKPSTLKPESVPIAEKGTGAKPRKKRKKPAKKTDSSLGEGTTETQDSHRTLAELQAQEPIQTLDCALNSGKANTTSVSHQLSNLTANKPGIQPVRIYGKQGSTIVKANYNVDFPSLGVKPLSDVQVSPNTVQSMDTGTTQPSFAEKLKKPKENLSSEKEAETPFLDWRDQRTKDRKITPGKKPVSANAKMEVTDVKISSTSKSCVSQPNPLASQLIEEAKTSCPSEEFVMQKGKRRPASSKRSSEISQSPADSQVPNVSVSQLTEVEAKSDKKAKAPLSPEARAKLQAKRKAKREQQKEEKKRVREQKLLHDKLASKDQKVRIITSEIMSHYNKPVQNPRPENYMSVSLQDFPTLEHSSKLDRAESPVPGPSSYSAALQRVAEPISNKGAEPVPPASSVSAGKKLKRRDPIEFNLFATALTKSQLKAAKQERRKNVYLKNKVQKSRERTGVKVVANPLDSSAPSFSRGKIRQKKKRVTYVEKAQLREKLRKQAVTKMLSENWDPNDTNLDELISLLGSKLTSHGRLRMKEELETILALYNTQRTQDGTQMTNKDQAQGARLHSRRFRDYCNQLLKDDIDELLTHLLLELHRFQDRAYNLDPIKAKSKRRLVLGLKEVTKQVERKRVKIVILVPDIQACPGTGGLDEAVARLLDAARSQGLPIIYGLGRRKLGRLLKKKVPASCCGILNYQSMEETFRKLWGLVEEARSEYEAKYQQLYGPKENDHYIDADSGKVEKVAPILMESLCQRVQTVSL